MPSARAVFPLLLLVLSACASTLQPVPAEWLQVTGPAPIRAVTLTDDGKVEVAARPAHPSVMDKVRVERDGRGYRLVAGERVLTETFAGIDSFDVSESRGEVVFSAYRERDFDIGLVSVEGSNVNWVPRDAADEVQVSWAPRGNKISFVVRAPGGDLIRTVHVPTAIQLSVDFPYSHVHALGWEPKAERYAAVVSSVDSSDRVDVLKYGGEEQRTVVPAEVRLDVVTEVFAGGALLLRPSGMRYNEKLPLVVWISDVPNGWNDARGALLRSTRMACISTKTAPDAAFWQAVAEIPWIDATTVFVVETTGRANARIGDALWIAGEPSLPAGHYRRENNVVRVSAAVVESFAAGFIAEQLKRTTPTNGRSR